MKKLVCFKDTWAYHFPWAEPVVGDDGLVSQVRCTVYSKFSKKPELLAPKFDMLHMHVGHRKAIVPSLGVVIGD
jgi:hypothetical protein